METSFFVTTRLRHLCAFHQGRPAAFASQAIRCSACVFDVRGTVLDAMTAIDAGFPLRLRIDAVDICGVRQHARICRTRTRHFAGWVGRGLAFHQARAGWAVNRSVRLTSTLPRICRTTAARCRGPTTSFFCRTPFT